MTLRITYGEATDLGWRPKQEDRAHCVQASNYTYLAIYDGHGSDKFAEHCKHHLHQHVVSSEDFQKGDVAQALASGFRKEDEELVQVTTDGNEGGTTASVVVIQGTKLYVANVGDSRVVLGEKVGSGDGGLSTEGNEGKETGVQGLEQDEAWRAWKLTRDHVPNDPVEVKRIEQAGGQIFYGRVLGVLNITRALGDHVFKFPFNRDAVSREDVDADFLSAVPHVVTIELVPQVHSILLVASDGLWNSVNELEAIKIAGELRDKGKSAQQVAESLLEAAGRNREGSGGDNVTCVCAFLEWDDGASSGGDAAPAASAAATN